jgi:hypothetical protein
VRQIVDRSLAVGDVPTLSRHDGRKKPQILEGYMPQSHGGSSGYDHRKELPLCELA